MSAMDYINQARQGAGEWWKTLLNGHPATYGAPSATQEAWGGIPFSIGSMAPAAAPGWMDSTADSGWRGGYGGGQAPMTMTGANASVIDPGSGGLKNWLSDGRNLGAVIGGFGTLAQTYLGFKQLKAAKDQLNFQKDAFAQNMGNQTQSYNTSLEDKIRGRTSSYAGKENDVASYLAKHSLKHKP